MSSSWDELAALAKGCVACPELASTRQHVVFGQRPAAPRPYDLVLLGEAPGADEDATGEPFVGRSGQLLDRLLAEAGVARATVGVVNVLKCRPPGNRKPARGEMDNCRGFLDRQLMLLDPLVLVTLGGTATEAMFGRGARLTQLRGQDHRVGGRTVIVTYHPSAAIRFGPQGVPRAALAEDLGYAAARAAELRTERDAR
ncbi:uracil-DNA glycosylase [Acidothermaceae bacterium B102]|nr:uracil-DNA glycosylase [Acidothermaceae bacterium B102]